MKSLPLFWLSAIITSTPAQAFDVDAAFGTPGTSANVKISGQVLEENKSLPLPDATLLVTWQASTHGFHSTNYICLRADATQTDTNGQFEIEAEVDDVFRRGLFNQYLNIHIHKDGWMDGVSGNNEDGRSFRIESTQKRLSLQAALNGGVLTLRNLDLTVGLIPSTLDAHDRVRYLYKASILQVQCETIGNTALIQSYWKALATEANRLAKSKYEKSLAKNISARVDRPIIPYKQGQNAQPITYPAILNQLDDDDPDSRDHQDSTALMKAAANGDAASVLRLLEKGANPNRTRFDGESALTIAINEYGYRRNGRKLDGKSHLGVIEALLRNAATDPDIRARRGDRTPLMKALEHGQPDVVSMLLDAGADPNITTKGKQFSALSIATKKVMSEKNSAGVPMPSATDQFNILLTSKKLDINMPTRYLGETALIAAVAWGNAEITRKLLAAGADPNARDLRGNVPLIVATEGAIGNPTSKKHVETVKVLANADGIQIEAAYKDKTAWQLATKANRRDLLQILKRQ
ncbi:hypothetical protein SCL_2476 [Sulfuricaulis limicola]|uniref:Uncharacterized protein n=2 Tax=Sulfuricaulis limicola TaxID=1620215 RepID=A0A1B4XIX6_9GAMM|nr:hypothetical protein SCL_2476 [Sulfuricaulis limicola]